IERSARSLLLVISDIFDVSHLERGALAIQKVKFPLGELIEESWRNFAAAAAEKGLELTCYIAPAILGNNLDGKQIMVEGDPARLAQILSQLLGNAIKFTQNGSVQLRVSFSEDAVDLLEAETEFHRNSPQTNEKSGFIWFEIADTGIGIPENFQNEIFQSFTQADSSITRQYGGTGLGLSISKRLIELMGGSISVTSCEGVGSVFRFCLPGRFPISIPAELSTVSTPIIGADLQAESGLIPERAAKHGMILLSPFAATRKLVQQCAEDLRMAFQCVEISDLNWQEKLPPLSDSHKRTQSAAQYLVLLEGNLALSEAEYAHLRALSDGSLVRLVGAIEGTNNRQNFTQAAPTDPSSQDMVLMRPLCNRVLMQIWRQHYLNVFIANDRGASEHREDNLGGVNTRNINPDNGMTAMRSGILPTIAPLLSSDSPGVSQKMLSQNELPQNELPQNPPSEPATAPANILTILLAEDNWINQTVAQTLLQKLGHRVVTANNGLEALAALPTDRFDLLLMDLQMPELDGEAATRQIRGNPAYDHLPIIALTAHAYAGLREQLINQGFDDYLPKPLCREDFVDITERWRQGRILNSPVAQKIARH
ncbi:MAG: ATP-binding protein, partial [Alphaproteobacteria bacterium]|nr:ATP-binding protein [Alphaproteobacteria bacterium]